MTRMLDLILKIQRGELPPPPIATLIGFRIAAVEAGSAVMEMEAGPQHANPMGTLHGGILGDLADAAMGMAYASTLDEGESFTTLELKINFLKPVWTGRLVDLHDPPRNPGRRPLARRGWGTGRPALRVSRRPRA
jgi:uncharacterized protein (TIGR00369 family)